jgi:hypothetical protein
MAGEKKGKQASDAEVKPHTKQASHSDNPETQPESGAGPEVRENQMPGNIDRDPRDDI